MAVTIEEAEEDESDVETEDIEEEERAEEDERGGTSAEICWKGRLLADLGASAIAVRRDKQTHGRSVGS